MDPGIRRRPDLLLVQLGRERYADVTITHPTTAQFLAAEHPEAAKRPLVAADAAERIKRVKYGRASSGYSGVDVVPVAMETLGGIGKATYTLLRAIAQDSKIDIDEDVLYRRGVDQLSVSLVRATCLYEHVGVVRARRLAVEAAPRVYRR
jgi:hypothetical protein